MKRRDLLKLAPVVAVAAVCPLLIKSDDSVVTFNETRPLYLGADFSSSADYFVAMSVWYDLHGNIHTKRISAEEFYRIS